MMRRRLAVMAVACAVTVAGCSHAGSTGGGAVAATTTTTPQVLTAFGSTAGFGGGLGSLTNRLRNSWPQLLFRDAFPLSTVLMNLSDPGSTIDDAVKLGLPVALPEGVTIAAIWLGPDGQGPCTTDTTATRFEPALTALVRPLRASGARVIIGNVPDGVACAVAFNAAVTNVARAQRATVADVASALASTPKVGPASTITLAQSRAIAAAFVAAVGGA